MTAQVRFARRYAFGVVAFVVALILLVITIRGDYHRNLHTVLQEYVSGNPSNPRDNKVHRFNNGRIAVSDSRFKLSRDQLAKMSAADLETLYENVVLETTADCSTARRLGRREDGGWDMCLVGPFTPQQPCFSFSFGVNNIWEFDDEVAVQFKCQVFTFDPSMSQDSHMRNDRIVFLKEGLHSSMGILNSSFVNTYLGFLKRFRVKNYIVDILTMNIGGSEWASLETAVRDGSLKNVKQLMLETHIGQVATVQEFLRYFSVLNAIHELGFRQWRHNWNTYGNYASKLNGNQIRSCCHELYFININFLSGTRPVGNPAGTQVLAPLNSKQIAKTGGFSQVEAVRGVNLTIMPEESLEGMHFGIVEQTHVTCPYSERIGGSDDGGWDICFSSPFNIMESKPCVAFSFGINNVWGYDDQLADQFKCKVYMFDPSMAVNDHQRKKTSWFYRTGLSSENKVETNGWKMRTLCKLFEELGYSGKTVDILKIDIEHWEWVSFEKALQEGCLKQVKQLLFETHTGDLVRLKSDYSLFLRVWRGLFDLGFRTWKWHKNPYSVFFKSRTPPHIQRACCYEHYMLNTRFVKL